MKKLSLLLLVSASSLYSMHRTALLPRLALQNMHKSPVILHNSQQRRNYNVFSDLAKQYGSYRPHMHALAGVGYSAAAIYCAKTGNDPNILATLAAARLASAITLASDNSGIRVAGGLLNMILTVPMTIGVFGSSIEFADGLWDYGRNPSGYQFKEDPLYWEHRGYKKMMSGLRHLGWTGLEAMASIDAVKNLIFKKPSKRTEEAFKKSQEHFKEDRLVKQ